MLNKKDNHVKALFHFLEYGLFRGVKYKMNEVGISGGLTYFILHINWTTLGHFCCISVTNLILYIIASSLSLAYIYVVLT